MISELKIYNFRRFKSVDGAPGLKITFHKGLNALIGDRKFKEYLKTRDKVNEENRKRNKLFIQIEF